MESRLIPAWAGKTQPATKVLSRARAHPRVGGENQDVSELVRLPSGSSPRGRGKLLRDIEAWEGYGLIPAWAGKTLSGVGLGQTRWAHPRVGGENYERKTGEPITCGSSPRGRGKRCG